MGVSFYYAARRERLMSAAESESINAAIDRFPFGLLVSECGGTEDEFDGESFCVYRDNEPGAIFEGATKLPRHSEEAFAAAVQYWCRLLSEIRHAIPDAEWQVHVDDCDIPWNADLRIFDPMG